MSIILSAADESDKAVRNICQSLQFFYRLDVGTFGSQVVIYPLWVARQHYRKLPRYKREFAWCLGVKDIKRPGFWTDRRMMTYTDIDSATPDAFI